MVAALPIPALPLLTTEWLRGWLGSDRMLALGLGLGVLSLAGLLGLPYFITRLPADYFTRSRDPNPVGIGRWLMRGARNLLGVLLLLLGIALLVLPGQGVLTILAAIICMDLPLKRRLERWFLAKPRVSRAINALRTSAGRPPFDFEHCLSSRKEAREPDSKQRR